MGRTLPSLSSPFWVFGKIGSLAALMTKPYTFSSPLYQALFLFFSCYPSSLTPPPRKTQGS